MTRPFTNGKLGGWRPGIRDRANEQKISRRLGARRRGTPVNPALKDPRYFPKIRDQGDIGSCTGHGVRSALAYKIRQQLGEKLEGKWGEQWDLSPLAMYFLGREKEGKEFIPQDVGCIIGLVIQACVEHGIPTEEAWPYVEKKYKTRPTKKALDTGRWHQACPGSYRCDEDGDPHHTIDRMLQALENDLPLVYGFATYENIGEADTDGIIRPPKGAMDGGHCVDSFWADTKDKIFWGPNSWDPTWGGPVLTGARYDERGYIGLPFQYIIDGLADDIWAVDLETVG
jgi:hypothetical protein